MEVVAYLSNQDLLLEDSNGVKVIGGSHYVLSLGDQVYLQDIIDAQANIYQVEISFEGTEHARHVDQVQLKFEGCRDKLKQYLQVTTVH